MTEKKKHPGAAFPDRARVLLNSEIAVPYDYHYTHLRVPVNSSASEGLQDLVEQPAQTGNVPIPIAQVINIPVLHVRGARLERAIEGLIGGPDTQLGIQHQEWLAHRFDSRFKTCFAIGVTRVLCGDRLIEEIARTPASASS